MTGVSQDLDRAWRWRERAGLFVADGALRVFHGPGEGSGSAREFAVDRFGEHYWVTEWEGAKSSPALLSGFVEFLVAKGARSVVHLGRPEKGVPPLPQTLWGEAPQGRFEVKEGAARFLIQLAGARHPGLFLDHAPLRAWLIARAKGWKVLNTFAYTGSLSIAAALGGAREVTTLDLSGPTTEWAQGNWRANQLDEQKGRFISGDVFEWLPRLKRAGEQYDCVILDPPSFSRSKKGGSFSTSKDLGKLHALALAVLSDGGMLATSINSANVSWERYASEVSLAAKEARVSLEILSRIDLPETFPTSLQRPEDRYLKGWLLRSRRDHK